MNPGVKNESVNFKAMVMSFALGFKIQGTSSEKSVSHSSILLANKMACRSFLWPLVYILMTFSPTIQVSKSAAYIFNYFQD